MVKYTLNYFEGPGRAEAIRLMFHAAGVEFNDNRMSKEVWQQNKPDCELMIFFAFFFVISKIWREKISRMRKFANF